MTYAGEGKIILTTKIKLKLNGKILKLSAIEEDLNNRSGFSFPVHPKWRSLTGTSTSSHFGQISILIGGDNHIFCPELKQPDPELPGLHGFVPPNIITWKEPLISSPNI